MTAGLGLALAAPASVLACTGTMGNMTLSPTSGAPGMRITTSASGLAGLATYALHFANSTSTNCMSWTGVTTLVTIKTAMDGSWSGVTAVIPANAKLGPHSICGMETRPMKGESGTSHDTFTVT